MERRPHAFSTWLSTTWRTRISFSWRVHDAAGAGLRSSFSDAGRLLEGAEPEVALLAATRPEVEPLLRVVEAPRSFGEPAEPPGIPGKRLLPGAFHPAEKGLDLRPGSSKEGNLRLRPLKQAPGIRKRGPQSRSRSIMHPPREGYPGPPGS